mgnify:CR=1 FL=1
MGQNPLNYLSQNLMNSNSNSQPANIDLQIDPAYTARLTPPRKLPPPIPRAFQPIG